MMDHELEQFIHTLVRIGKENKWLKYPIVALLFVMAAVYDSLHLARELLSPKMRRRILAGALSLCMALALLPMNVFAVEPVQTALLAEGDAISLRLLRCTRGEGENDFTPVSDWQEGSGTSLENAVRTLVPDLNGNKNTLSELVITGGMVTDADWTFLLSSPCSFWLKKLTFEPNVTVAPVHQRGTLSLDRLEEINYPQATEIGDSQFSNNTDAAGNLKKVNMPNVRKIGEYAFSSRSGLKAVDFPLVTELGKGAFKSAGLTSASFPEVTVIPASCFSTCYDLKTVSFPKAVTIGEFAFSSSTVGNSPPYGLTQATFESATEIGRYAFMGQQDLTKASFPKVTQIDSFAFAYCRQLKTLEIGSVETIGVDAFQYQESLKYLSLPAVPPTPLSPRPDQVFQGNAYKYIQLVDKDGKTLEGKALNKAIDAYIATGMTGEADSSVEPKWKGTQWLGGLLPKKVEIIAVTGVALNKPETTLMIGGTETVVATIAPENATDKTVTWSSSAPAVATVDDAGLVTAVSAGTATITVTTVDVGKTAACTVTVQSNAHTIAASAEAGGTISPSGSVSVADRASQSFTISANSGYSIASVTVDGVNQGAISSYIFPEVTANHTISAAFSRNSSGGSDGSSGGGSSSGGDTVKPPVAPEKENPSKGESTVTAPVDQNGNASVTVSDKNISDAIAQAKKGAVQGQPIAVSIKVETDKAATQITATLPETVQETLISNKVDSITIASNTVTMDFSQMAIQQMNSQAKADITIIATKVDNGKLIGDAKAWIGNRPMYDFKAVYGNNKSITDFGGSTVSIVMPYTLGAGEAAEHIGAVYVDDNGKATAIANSRYDAGRKAVLFTTSHFSGYGVGYKQVVPLFGDIVSHWAKADIEFVAARGLLSGTSKTAFSPNTAMTRGMFVTALGKMEAIDTNSYSSGNFTDVKAGAYYAAYVNWAESEGVTAGTTATTFRPDQAMTRQEMAVFMSNYAGVMGYTVPKTRVAVTFADSASIESWAEEAVKSMQMADVVMAEDDNLFDPAGVVARAEASAVLRRYMELVIDPSTARGLM